MIRKLKLTITYKNGEFDSAYINGTIRNITFVNKIACRVQLPINPNAYEVDIDLIPNADNVGCFDFCDDENNFYVYFNMTNPTEWFRGELYDIWSYPLVNFEEDISNEMSIEVINM
jgi:hypothetical protein